MSKTGNACGDAGQGDMAAFLRSLYFKCAPHPGQGCDAGLPLRGMRGKDFSLAQHFDQLRDPAGSIHALR